MRAPKASMGGQNSFATKINHPREETPELDWHDAALFLDSTSKDEFRSASPAPRSIDTDLLSSVLNRLDELEEKIDVLQSKPSKMPHEKEELLNAAVYRVDALEAELIATKKALHQALIRQEELLEYIDRQEEAKFREYIDYHIEEEILLSKLDAITMEISFCRRWKVLFLLCVEEEH
ncbi:hypothetical protein KSP40_PGU010520 [Platanthera guangdongensis]|uniref:Uncharacterized protein n=1 Tax=Platanthera guangdongensis TaxID=2320717 RepID=A0ABR2MG26_9ASPA